MTLVKKTPTILLFFCLVLPCLKAEENTDEIKTKITIRVVYAVKDKEAELDPRLKDIQAELRELPFSSFNLLDRLETDIQLDATVELQFGDKQIIAVSFKGTDGYKNKTMIALQIAIKPAAKITFRVADGGRAILGGPSYRNGMLFIEVSGKLQRDSK